MNQELVFEKAVKSDVKEMTEVMKRAFDEDTKRHLGREAGGPPGYDDGGFINRWYIESGADAYKVICNGRIIGGFNVFRCDRHRYCLGNIFVDPNFQDQGLGTKIWSHIEGLYLDAVKWSTETPGFSRRNHNFYVNKCGFKIVRIENPKDPEEASYILEKEMKSGK